jgi:ethanolamine utilization protein EutP
VTTRVMIIGAIGSGKSTLAKRLLNREEEAAKTQTLQFEDWVVDTPGEYAENPLYYKAIMATALEVTHVLLVQDATRPQSIFPPGFATGIPKKPIGVVTKSDHPSADVPRAIELLRFAVPVGPIVVTSSFNGEGLEELLDWLDKCKNS